METKNPDNLENKKSQKIKPADKGTYMVYDLKDFFKKMLSDKQHDIHCFTKYKQMVQTSNYMK